MAAKVTLINANWNPQAENLLMAAVGNNPSYTINELKNEVASGTSRLVQVVEDGKPLGYVVYFIEVFGGGRELVLQAGAAISGDLGALRKAVPALAKLARNAGAPTMRAHLGDSARLRLFKKAGFQLAEYVVRTGV